MRRSAWIRAGFAACAGALALGAGGCVGYATSPTRSKQPFEKPSPIYAVQEICAASAAYVVEKFPINGPYAVNLPAGLSRSDCERIIRLMKDENARVLTASTQSLPIVHVETVSVIGDGATSRVFRPVGLSAMQGSGKEATLPGGPTALTQCMELRVQGGLRPWHAVAMRGLMLGAIPTPELNIIPDDGSAPPEAVEPEAPAASEGEGAGT